MIVLLNCAPIPATREPVGPIASTPYSEEDRDMAAVQTPLHTFRIDRYEMSELRKGDFFAVPNQQPRTGITITEARKVCADLGKRLCTSFEWTNACLGTSRQRFGYGQTEKNTACNTQGAGAELTGNRESCRSENGIQDMIGNVMEWVEGDEPGMGAALGGSFQSGTGTDCFTSRFLPLDTVSPQIGFRCCK